MPKQSLRDSRIRYHCLMLIAAIAALSSCSTLENASMHGFKNGYYKLQNEGKGSEEVYVDIREDTIDVYPVRDKKPERNTLMTVSLSPSDSQLIAPLVFRKNSLDIDITSVLLKYRPSVYGLPAQLNTDFNVALFAGWRLDRFKIKATMDPLGRGQPKIRNLGYDFGFFAGPGATTISPFTTRNQRTDEYNALIIQTGFAAFIESNIASFGVSVGIDNLMNPDRSVWIYTRKPWVGFIVGIALN